MREDAARQWPPGAKLAVDGTEIVRDDPGLAEGRGRGQRRGLVSARARRRGTEKEKIRG